MSEAWRVDVLGSLISAVDAEEALGLIAQRLDEGAGGYVCFSNVHTVVMGRRDPAFRAITNASFLSVADGKPVYWTARTQGPAGHVPGPDFMKLALDRYRSRRHFLYGSTDAVLDRLSSNLRQSLPGLQICGKLSPPFRALSAAERQQHYDAIRASGAELVWVGLGAPKQEQWMAEAAHTLRPAILLGVGAAFDFQAEVVGRAPKAMRDWGLEWFYRLLSQPRRLWRRYLTTNTLFLVYLAQELRNRRRGRTETDTRH